MFEKLARSLARWHAKVKNWHALWHAGTFFGTLASKNENLAHFWHVDNQARWHVNHAGPQARWHAGTHGTRYNSYKTNSLTNLLSDEKRIIMLKHKNFKISEKALQ